MALRRTIVDVITVCVVGVLCLPILLLLAPNIETGRTEARALQAYVKVRDIRSTIDESPASVIELEEHDPWGEPYCVMPIEHGMFRVVSSGPDMLLSPAGVGGDDIYSDMPVSPAEPFRTRRNWQWLLAFSVTIGTWALLATLYLCFRRRLRRSPASNSSSQDSDYVSDA